MLEVISRMYGHQLGAVDGDIGHIKDAYFDDRRWGVRFLVIDTGSWLPGRQVLVSPHNFTSIDHARKRLLVSLTKDQIEKSPFVETHKPISRQFEIYYYKRSGLPFYWQGDGLWGLDQIPNQILPTELPRDVLDEKEGGTAAEDLHLRNTRAVHGHSIQASDGEAGHISDFLIDDATWAIPELVVKTGGWFSGKEVVIPTDAVEQISYEKAAVTVKMSMRSIKESPVFHKQAASAR